ncbi:DDB1- and CUL4-associated factor 5 isoform X2 [Helicoverpa armigera]|uniref:DDB1- and CUL4-associated factor 5 isoform X2 n=1 Tax=Helicoverpa armigera TaxID=29058 RepID=UPI0021118ABE|nr:DDB1- and CUL4-associated factor 5 isoform X2 [Helicoverpa armigera]
MANIANPLSYLNRREYGLLPDIKSQFFNKRLNAAKNLYRRELVCHFGCVNAIEFSSNGELLVSDLMLSGGDDRRVMLWQFGQAILDRGKPVAMKGLHQSNVFCLGITNDNQKIYSGGNDDIVIVHDLESKCPLEVLQHQRAVCSLSIDPFNERVVTTAGNDGRLLLFDTRQSVHESLVISRSRKAFHGVMFHPSQSGMLTSANSRDGVALWDLRSPKHPILRYAGANGTCQNCMSVRFNSAGTHILALRRRQAPVLYAVHSPEPVAEFYHQDYYNSCTMKSCTFAGEGDQFVLSGSDDFNLYMWKIPEDGAGFHVPVEPPHIVLYGHRSIVNQVRYNPHYCLIASSGVEKIIKVWSAVEFPKMRGTLLEEAQGSDNPREIYSHEDYVSLVHHSGQYISHNYADQSTSEDPRMMAFFDSLVQRELECLAEETDSLDGSSSGGSVHDNDSDSSDTDQIVVDFLPLPPKRANPNGNRSQRCPNRLARLVAQRYSKNLRSQKRGSLRRSKQSRSSLSKSSSKCGGSQSKGKRAASRRSRGPRRPAPRAPRVPPHVPPHAHSRLSAPSSERTDSDEPAHSMFRNSGRMIRPLRRRINLTRTAKRKTKVTSYRKPINLRSNGAAMAQDSSDNNNFSNFDNFDDNLAQPSTSTGYRGQNTSALFRIAEVDSDDDQSVSSRPISPRNQNGNQNIPPNLVSIIPTPINGSRDSLGDSLRVEPAESESTNNSSPPPPENRRMNLRRVRRNGRLSLHRSDSSESPPPKDQADRASTSVMEPHSPKVGYNRTVARLMNETNESELESSCSTESSMWPAADVMGTPDSGVGTVVGSSTRNSQPRADDVSDDPEYQAFKFRQRVKKARRNYREHMDSDSN